MKRSLTICGSSIIIGIPRNTKKQKVLVGPSSIYLKNVCIIMALSIKNMKLKFGNFCILTQHSDSHPCAEFRESEL